MNAAIPSDGRFARDDGDLDHIADVDGARGLDARRRRVHVDDDLHAGLRWVRRRDLVVVDVGARRRRWHVADGLLRLARVAARDVAAGLGRDGRFELAAGGTRMGAGVLLPPPPVIGVLPALDGVWAPGVPRAGEALGRPSRHRRLPSSRRRSPTRVRDARRRRVSVAAVVVAAAGAGDGREAIAAPTTSAAKIERAESRFKSAP